MRRTKVGCLNCQSKYGASLWKTLQRPLARRLQGLRLVRSCALATSLSDTAEKSVPSGSTHEAAHWCSPPCPSACKANPT